jgi:hypothetical protein
MPYFGTDILLGLPKMSDPIEIGFMLQWALPFLLIALFSQLCRYDSTNNGSSAGRVLLLLAPSAASSKPTPTTYFRRLKFFVFSYWVLSKIFTAPLISYCNFCYWSQKTHFQSLNPCIVSSCCPDLPFIPRNRFWQRLTQFWLLFKGRVFSTVLLIHFNILISLISGAGIAQSV